MKKRLAALLDRVIDRANARLERSGNPEAFNHAKVTHEASMSAVVTRADGRVEDLGEVSKLRHTSWDIKKLFNRKGKS